MTRISTLASVAVVTLLLATGSASAFGPIGGLADSINSGGNGGGSSEPGVPFNPAVSDAVITTTDEALTDAILDGQHSIPIDTVVLGGGKGEKGKGQVRIGARTLMLAFTCEVGANDLLTLANAGDAVPAGTKIRWDVRSESEHGTVRLKQALQAGEKVRVDAGTRLDAGTPCAAKAI